MTFDWNHVRAFLVTAEEGSLSAAARSLGLTQPTLGRQVDGLERDLGAVLFVRAGRGLVLTPAGQDLLAHAAAMGEGARSLSAAAFARNEAMEGRITIAAGEADAAHLLPPILARMRRAAPGLQIEVLASSGPADLTRREADVALRNFRPTEPDLIARKLRDGAARLYATPAYLDGLDPIETPADLACATFIGLDDGAQLMDGLNALGLGLSADNFPYRCANFLVMWEMVRHGLGVGVMDDRIGDADPSVRRALPGLEALSFPVWLVAHRDLHRNRRLRFVVDMLAQELG